MGLFDINLYSNLQKDLWNQFVSNSKNGTFLFHRDFMEYHNDRFEDYSLMIYKKKKLIALLPANKVGKEIYSHQGLSYGGLLLNRDVKMNDVVGIYDAMITYLKNSNLKKIFFKIIPDIYCEYPSNELVYLLNKTGAELYRVDVEMVVDYSKPLTIHKTKLKRFNKSLEYGLKIKKTNDLSNFWNLVLEPKLMNKYDAKPVHSLSEIQSLKNLFPDNIYQYDVYFEDNIVAGITLFETENVIKSQYGAATEQGESLRALEYLFIHLIDRYKEKGKIFFSMGTVNGLNTLGYNEGLLKQKEELGCSIFLQEFYFLELE